MAPALPAVLCVVRVYLWACRGDVRFHFGVSPYPLHSASRRSSEELPSVSRATGIAKPRTFLHALSGVSLDEGQLRGGAQQKAGILAEG
eukprot:5053155-Pyramimonas_sp.AAC.1